MNLQIRKVGASGIRIITKPILLVFGWISIVLGVIGAILPIMPTTPFLILAAFLFSKSSPKMHSWLTSLPYFGDAIIEWERHRVIKPQSKAMASWVLVSVMGSSLYFVDMPMALKIALALVGVAVLVFVWTRKSKVE